MDATERKRWEEKCSRWVAAAERGETDPDWKLVAQELATVAGEFLDCIERPSPAGLVVTDNDLASFRRNGAARCRALIAKVWRLTELQS